MLTLLVLLLLIGGLVVWLIQVYNQLVALKAQYENGFAQIEVQLRRRYDLIPNLVETVKGYLRHENTTLTTVIEARNMAHSLLKAASLTLPMPAPFNSWARPRAGWCKHSVASASRWKPIRSSRRTRTSASCLKS